jgi:hypothetical protein
MTRRFQFSLGRLLAAVGLLCAVIALGRMSLEITVPDGQLRLGMTLMSLAGIAAASLVGVLIRRTPWLALGAAIGLIPALWYIGINFLWVRD